MDGIVTITMDITSMDEENKSKLGKELRELGLQKTLPETERGGILHLPECTYGRIIELDDDQMAQLKHYYRSLVDIMRKLSFKGRYFVNVSANPAYVCGCL